MYACVCTHAHMYLCICIVIYACMYVVYAASQPPAIKATSFSRRDIAWTVVMLVADADNSIAPSNYSRPESDAPSRNLGEEPGGARLSAVA